MYLVACDRSGEKIAQSLADIHLKGTLNTCATLLSAAIVRASGDEIVMQDHHDKAKRPYHKGYKIFLLPPDNDPMMKPWVDWLTYQYKHAYWLFGLAWQLDKQMRIRFRWPEGTHDVMFDCVKAAVSSGIMAVINRKEEDMRPFPIVLPNAERFIQIPDSIQAYREYYKDLKFKMKWTGTSRPEWMGGPAQKKCSQCQSTMPELCTLDECELRPDYSA